MAVPEQCQRCYKYHRQTIDSGCPLCKNVGFAEHVLCDITRQDQVTRETFECGAFRLHLMVVGGKTTSSTQQEKDTQSSHNLLKSERIKWSLAYAKQQLAMHPDKVIYDLKYHLCVATKFRQPHFSDASRYAEEIDDIIRESSEASARTVQFLSMGANHLHLYIDATPDDVMDEVVHRLLAKIEPKIQEIVWGDTSSGKALCNPVYFIEAI